MSLYDDMNLSFMATKSSYQNQVLIYHPTNKQQKSNEQMKVSVQKYEELETKIDYMKKCILV